MYLFINEADFLIWFFFCDTPGYGLLESFFFFLINLLTYSEVLSKFTTTWTFWLFELQKNRKILILLLLF